MKPLNPLKKLDIACFLRSQLYLAPVLLLFYQQNGLTIADFVMFQGIFQLTGILFEVPCGYIADITSKKKVLILAFTCFFLRAALWLSFSGVYIVLLGELFNALSRAFLSGVYDSYIFDFLKSKSRTPCNTRINKLVIICLTCYILIKRGKFPSFRILFYILRCTGKIFTSLSYLDVNFT